MSRLPTKARTRELRKRKGRLVARDKTRGRRQRIVAYRAGPISKIGHGIFFTRDEAVAIAYSRAYGGRVIKAEIDLNNSLDILVRTKADEPRVNAILKKIFPGGRHVLESVKDVHGKHIGWKDKRIPVTWGDLGWVIREEAWLPIIKYAKKHGHDSIITRDSGPLLEIGTVSYIILDRKNIKRIKARQHQRRIQ